MAFKYIDLRGRSQMPFQVYIGARGIGKTYPALAMVAEDLDEYHKFMLLRRTDSELQQICTEYANPYKAYNNKHPEQLPIQVELVKNMGIFYVETDEGKKTVGYCCALSTFAKMRGIDFTDVTHVIFDEFIPEKHVHKIKNEGDAFLHFYETVNRNRELEGEEPLKVFLLANAINLSNPILLTLGVVSKIAEMKIQGKCKFTDRKRKLYVELLENADFTKAKGETVLYSLAGGTSFSEEALNNNFNGDNFNFLAKVNKNEYVPYMSVAKTYVVYRHKSTNEMYICKDKAPKTVQSFEEMDRDILYWRFAPQYRMATLQRRIKFDDYGTKVYFDALLKRQ